MKKISIFSIIIAVSLILFACGGKDDAKSDSTSGSNGEKAEETITITHELGEAEVKKNPEKVVVFDFSALDTLDKLGIEVIGVPKGGTIPSYLSKYEDDKYENVGTLFEPDFEKIAEIDPDLILISGRQSEVYEDLQELAPTVYVAVDTQNYIESFKSNMEIIGQIFGKETEVEDELAAIDEKIASVKEQVTSLNKNALILLTNEGKISAYGTGSRFGLIHDVLGFEPVDTNIEASTHGQSISFEYVLEHDPDYIFVVDRTAVVGGETSAKEVIENELIKQTKAYKDGNIVYLDPNYWYLSGGGLVSVSEMISEIEAGIQ
ncbi:siderophore ABC transporter substrate-binding protein [Fervidibacillus halotolerans]|uniref:Siderophore ABC transporter substrate-binding protein n=1 Tax=Fervidibacillus halotolerans TaxID=2980027 RepID=A0A9E8RZ49_9BACI|nr:siderophore ABC transporter substrate-binding protein [Fervidibacillus halotolerans]WAA12948.1 siderophore ABC transporter substrate-binding protein [Fervidibacillus halotolerans]